VAEIVYNVTKDITTEVTAMTVTTHLSIAYTKTKSVSKAQQNHTERFDDKHKHTNKSIDPSKSAENINLRPEYEGMSYKQRFEAIVNSERYTGRRRKDGSALVIEGGKNATVKMLQLSVNIGQVDESGKPVDTLSKDDYIKLYKDDVLPMLEETFGADNIIGSAIHVDESKPHLHVDIVPLTPEGKLSAKQVVGGRGKMHQRQKQWLEIMQEKRPDLNFERKKEGVNGLALDKLKELTEQATAEAKKATDKEWERINKANAELNETKTGLNKFNNTLNRLGESLVEREDDLDKREIELEERENKLNEREGAIEAREKTLSSEVGRQVSNRTRERQRALNERENRLNEMVDKLADERTRERQRDLDKREGAIEERVDEMADERTRERMRVLDAREQGIAKTVAERTEKAVGERTRALDSREQALAGKEQAFDERLTAWERAKITLVDTLQKIPTAMQALAWWRKQSEDEDADKVADAIAEQVDEHTDSAINALADERLDEVQEHTNVLTKTADTLADGLDPAQFDLPDARELPSAQEVAESVNIDPSQFEVSNRQLTQG
jgi:plasmid recombination enzyme